MATIALFAGSLSFFLPLGVAAAYFGVLWGELFQSKGFLGLLSAFLFISGIATFFDWTFRLPQIFYRFPFHRHLGAFFTGALAGVLSTPCTGPFLGSVLAYSVTQPPSITLAVFALVGIGLAFPYGVLLLYPSLLDRLPRNGRLAADIKSFLGVILIGGALFFAQALVPKIVIAVFAYGILLLFVGWAVACFHRSRVWTEKAFPSFCLLLAVAGLMFHFGAPGTNGIVWQEFKNGNIEALQRVVGSGSPAFIEFTADWCLNCKVLEGTVYQDSSVGAAFSENAINAIRFDMTEFSDDQKQVLTFYGGNALPYAVLVESDGSVIEAFSGMFSTAALINSISKNSLGVVPERAVNNQATEEKK